MNKIFGPRAHLSAKTIVKLMYSLSELIIIMGKYFGIYAKDSLDELLLTTHHKSSYRGKSRKVERRAFSEWMDVNVNIKDEADTNVAKILGHMSHDGEWIVDPKSEENEEWQDDFPYEYNEDDIARGDNFPYISHLK